jgi:transmembrane sensor
MKDDTQLARWLAGELEGEELETLKNSARYPSLVRIKENFERLESPQFDSEGMLHTIVAAEKTKTVKVVPLYRKAWFVAAAAIVVLLGAWFLFTIPEQFSSANGQTYAFVLPDQSEVILNDGSTAKFSKRNWDNNREVALEGEAYFKVAKGKTFTVNTPQGTVTVLGTQFNVKAREGRFEVVCYEGKVSVVHQKREFILTPQQGITFTDNTDTGVKEVNMAEPKWLNEEIAFTEESLSDVLAELERQYNVEIETGVQSKQLFTGTLPANDMDVALKVIAKTFHLEIQKNNGNIILKPVNGGK